MSVELQLLVIKTTYKKGFFWLLRIISLADGEGDSNLWPGWDLGDEVLLLGYHESSIKTRFSLREDCFLPNTVLQPPWSRPFLTHTKNTPHQYKNKDSVAQTYLTA